MVPQCKYFPQNVTSLSKRAKIVIPHKATEKFVPQHTEREWREERPLSTLSLSYKEEYPGFPTGVANMGGGFSKFDEGSLKCCQKITVKEFI